MCILSSRGQPVVRAYSFDRAREFSPDSGRDADQVYKAALRHSRHVRLLRIGVPAVLAAALLLPIGANYIPTVGYVRVPGELGKLVIKGTTVTMQQPHLTGFTNDSRPYEFSANSAEQDITKPDLMQLHDVHAKIELEDKSTVYLTSNSGSFDMKTEMLTLTESVHVLSTTGNEARLHEVSVDVHKGTAVSEKPVWVSFNKQGVVNSKGLEIRDNGDVIRFTGGVTMVVQPDQESKLSND